MLFTFCSRRPLPSPQNRSIMIPQEPFVHEESLCLVLCFTRRWLRASHNQYVFAFPIHRYQKKNSKLKATSTDNFFPPFIRQKK